MGALIILHGLFLLHCNVGTQTCEILAIQYDDHQYRALGAGQQMPLPKATNLKTWLPVPGTTNPDADAKTLASRVLVLTQGLAHAVSPRANTKIVVPMPDDILAANVVYPMRKDLLNGTPSNVLRTQPLGDGSIRVAETIILRYLSAGPFTLTDSGSFNIPSKQIGSYNVLALFAWPVNCTGSAHSAMNALIDIGAGANPTIVMMGLAIAPGHPPDDDGEVAKFHLPPDFLRPPCMQPVVDRKGISRTGSQTGCATEVIVDP